MNDVHEYSEDGVKWERIFTLPEAAIDTKFDPNDNVGFIEKSKKKNMSIGAMWDESARLSEKRAKHGGIDPIKEKAITDYEKKTKKKHPSKTKGGIVEI